VRRPGRTRAATAFPELSPRVLELRLERGHSIGERLGRRRADGLDRVLEEVEAGTQVGVRPRPGERLDAAHPRADAPLARDDEAADLAARAAVRAAAQLEAVVLDAYGPDRLAVFLVEER